MLREEILVGALIRLVGSRGSGLASSSEGNLSTVHDVLHVGLVRRHWWDEPERVTVELPLEPS